MLQLRYKTKKPKRDIAKAIAAWLVEKGIPSVYSHRPSFECRGEDFHLIMGGRLIRIWITDDEAVVVKRYSSPGNTHWPIDEPIDKDTIDYYIRMWGPLIFET